jgi:hypothetical protein
VDVRDRILVTALEVCAGEGDREGIERRRDVDRRLEPLDRRREPVDAIERRESHRDQSIRAADEERNVAKRVVERGRWEAYLDRELQEGLWRDLLARWWARLLPGIAAGSTHGVIRTAHAVRALGDGEAPERVAELGPRPRLVSATRRGSPSASRQSASVIGDAGRTASSRPRMHCVTQPTIASSRPSRSSASGAIGPWLERPPPYSGPVTESRS